MGGTRPSENPSLDFRKDCRTASQFCMLLSRPSMGSLGLSSSQVMSSMDFLKDCRITINRHPELVSGSVPPFIRGSTRLPYCIFVILVRGKSGMQKKARQVLEGPAEGGLRNEVEQWRRMPKPCKRHTREMPGSKEAVGQQSQAPPYKKHGNQFWAPLPGKYV